MKKVFRGLVIFVSAYSIGIPLGVLFLLMIFIGTVRVKKWHRIPLLRGRIILVSNHPSLLEPFLLPNLFFPEYLLFPFKFLPWSTPDRDNFYRAWYWFWLRSRAIPINRGSNGDQLAAFWKIKKILEKGGRVILFPEGGRTSSAESFYEDKFGNKLRSLKQSVGILAMETGATVIPVWVKGAEKVLPNRLGALPRLRNRAVIRVGKPMRINGTDKEEATRKITEALFELAAQT